MKISPRTESAFKMTLPISRASSAAAVQVTLGATLLAMALAIHLELAPYLRAEFDKAECLALAALSATLVGAITLVEGAQGTDQVQINLVVTVVLLLVENRLTMGSFVRHVGQQSICGFPALHANIGATTITMRVSDVELS
mgnify:CR=1 FL=1